MARETWPAMLMTTSSPAPGRWTPRTKVTPHACSNLARPYYPAERKSIIRSKRNDGWLSVLLQPAAVRTPNRGARGLGATGAPLCGSGPVAVPMGNLVAVGCRRGEDSIPVNWLPVAAHARKAPQASASAKSATSAFSASSWLAPRAGAAALHPSCRSSPRPVYPPLAASR